MKIPYESITPHFAGKAGLISGLAQQIGVDRIFNEALEKHTGRPSEVHYGTLAQMMLVNIADEHRPLSRLDEYFEHIDAESLFGHSNELLSSVSVAALNSQM